MNIKIKKKLSNILNRYDRETEQAWRVVRAFYYLGLKGESFDVEFNNKLKRRRYEVEKFNNEYIREMCLEAYNIGLKQQERLKVNLKNLIRNPEKIEKIYIDEPLELFWKNGKYYE